MRGDLYSRVVGWLKILLPLVALGLLATMFLFARAPVPQGDIPYVVIEDIARDPRIGAPSFSGVTPDGAAVTLAARAVRAQPDAPGALTVEGLRIEIAAPSRQGVVVTAQEGGFDSATRRATLTGLARVETTTGYRIEATGIEADLAQGTLHTLGPLAARAPFGSFEAGGLEVTGGGAHLVFKDGVRLLYQPPAEGARP
ncbi:MAG: hypothetical protein H3C51_07210 [Rubellimicrobium sp.]|nr:hypothetical protein [Rubellimicrobium sp.]